MVLYPSYKEVEEIVMHDCESLIQAYSVLSEYSKSTHDVIANQVASSASSPWKIDFTPVAKNITNLTAMQGVYYAFVAILRHFCKTKQLTDHQCIMTRDKMNRDFDGHNGWET